VAAPAADRLAVPDGRTWSGGPVWRAVGTLALFALSSAIALAVTEVLIRIVAPQQLVALRPDVWQPADTVGWRFRPNLNTTINTGERTVHVFTDRDGFRVGRAGRSDAATRVLLLGDSFMAALQVEFEQSLAGLLEQRLPARAGAPVAIRNTGQAGWDPPQYFFQARSLLGRDHFALVVVAVYLGNDIVSRRPDRVPPRVPVETYRLRLPRRFTGAEFTTALLRPLNDVLEQRSHAFIFAKSRLHGVLMRMGLTADDVPEEVLRKEATSPRWDVTADILADIAGLAALRGTPTLFVLIPAPLQVEPAVFRENVQGFGLDSSQFDLDQPTRLLRTRLEARGLPVVDVLPAFREADRNGPRLYGTVDQHLSPRGHEVLERLVEPRIAALLRRTSVHARRARLGPRASDTPLPTS
jgi:hypothetical protein